MSTLPLSASPTSERVHGSRSHRPALHQVTDDTATRSHLRAAGAVSMRAAGAVSMRAAGAVSMRAAGAVSMRAAGAVHS